MIELRPYQQKGVDEIRGEFLNGIEAPLYVLPTGGGKTVIFCDIARKASHKNNRVMILVHRVELLRQTSKALSKSGVEHGLINPKFTPNPVANVQVASVQTVINRLDIIQAPNLIIIDECHHAVAGSWKKVIEKFPNSRVLGVTATPIRTDGRGLDEIFQSLILGPSIGELIEMGYLVRPRIYVPPTIPDMSEVKIVRGDYDKSQVLELIDRPTITGDAVSHYQKLCSGAACVVFCVSIAHAEHVAEEFRKSGYIAYSVDGTMDDDKRSRILSGLGDGSIQVVTSCDLISEGTDIPAIECAILLRPTQSTGLYIQQVGRALRLSEGKTEAIILDHVGNVMNHGLPDSARDWTLEGRKKTKRSIAQEKDIAVKQCEECYAVYEPADSCPYCGFVNKVKYKSPLEIEGELVEIKNAEAIEKKEKRREVGRAKTMAELLVIQQERGHKPGWARIQFNLKNNRK